MRCSSRTTRSDETQRAALKLIAARAVQAGLTLATFVSTVPPVAAGLEGAEATGALTAEAQAAILTVAGGFSAVANQIGVIRSALYDSSGGANGFDGFDALNNLFSTSSSMASVIDDFEKGTYTAALGSRLVGGVLQVFNVLKTLFDISQDIRTKASDLDAGTTAYMEGTVHYNKLLQQLQTQMQAVNDGMRNCPPPNADPMPEGCAGGHNGGHIGTHAACKEWWKKHHPGQPLPKGLH